MTEKAAAGRLDALCGPILGTRFRIAIVILPVSGAAGSDSDFETVRSTFEVLPITALATMLFTVYPLGALRPYQFLCALGSLTGGG